MDISSLLYPVSRRAASVLDAIVARIPDGEDSVVVDEARGAFMALHASRAGRNEHGAVYSLAHYYEQNGDLVPDPLVDFLRTDDGAWFPLCFEMIHGRREYVAFKDDGAVLVDRKQQRDLASFCSMWMRNIEEQQGVHGERIRG